METGQLYYAQPYQREFDAQVLSCERVEGGYAVCCDATAFFPEGGGQACDLGTLGQAKVLDVQIVGERIVHLCDAPLTGTVHGKIDWDRRFDLMQQHSGEHLISGLVFRQFGYHNVGFHMGAELITIDFDGPLDMETLSRIEQEANEAIWADLPSEVFCPDPETLKTLSYRSKKALSGQVRLVRFPGMDLCACCGTHVARTGEIGIIKLLSCVRFHEGVRIEMLCGRRAYRYLCAEHEQNKQVSGLLSAKPLQTAQEVQRTLDELGRLKYRLTGLQDELFRHIAEGCAEKQQAVIFAEKLDAEGVRRLCNACMESCSGVCAVFSGEEGSYKYCIGQSGGDVRTLVKQLNEQLCGRGGGKPPMAQGSVSATKQELTAFFAKDKNGY